MKALKARPYAQAVEVETYGAMIKKQEALISELEVHADAAKLA